MTAAEELRWGISDENLKRVKNGETALVEERHLIGATGKGGLVNQMVRRQATLVEEVSYGRYHRTKEEAHKVGGSATEQEINIEKVNPTILAA